MKTFDKRDVFKLNCSSFYLEQRYLTTSKSVEDRNTLTSVSFKYPQKKQM